MLKKNFEVFLCSSPSLRLVQKSVGIPIFIKPNDLKFWELKVTCFSKLQPIFKSIQIYMWIVEA
jgi:hypothetical protein